MPNDDRPTARLSNESRLIEYGNVQALRVPLVGGNMRFVACGSIEGEGKVGVGEPIQRNEVVARQNSVQRGWRRKDVHEEPIH